MLRDNPEPIGVGVGVGGDQTQTTPATPTKLNPRKTVTKPTHQRRTVTDPAKCVFVRQILAIRAAEAEGKRALAETLKSKLIASSRGFIIKMARRYYGDDIDRDDVDATATMAFWRAVTTWQPDGGSAFDTWARWGMRMALQKMIRSSRMIRGTKKKRVSLASLDGDDAEDVLRGLAAVTSAAPLGDVGLRAHRLIVIESDGDGSDETMAR